MVLNFGGSELFKTSNEERWKGVDGERITEFPAADDDQGAGWHTVSTGSPVGTNVKVAVSVKPDEKVFVMADGTCNLQGYQSQCNMYIYKNGGSKRFTTAGEGANAISNSDVNMHSMALSLIDEPGEGIFEYEIYTNRDGGTASTRMRNLSISVFVLTVK